MPHRAEMEIPVLQGVEDVKDIGPVPEHRDPQPRHILERRIERFPGQPPHLHHETCAIQSARL